MPPTSIAPSPATTDAGTPPPKPKLRGVIHACTVPLVLAGGIILIVLAPTGAGKAALAIYLATAIILFANSAVYHLGHWSAPVHDVLRRIDHSNIFLFIAGTYTPLAVFILHGGARVAILAVIWGAALCGVLFRVLWLSAPRFLYVAIYIFMGWAAIWWMGDFWRDGGPVIVVLVLVGGVLYSLGALVYARKKPDPWPRWFGFHEIFHSCTVLAAAAHYAAIAIAVLGR